MKFLNLDEQKSCREVFLKPSKTIPDISVSVSEILENFTKPGFDELVQLGFYDDETNPNNIDLSQIDDLTEFMAFSTRAKELNRIYNEAMSAPAKLNNDDNRKVNKEENTIAQ